MGKELASQITALLEAGNFEGAEPLLANFFGGINANLAQIPAMPDRAAALQEALGWMYRWLSLSRVMRSHLNEQVRMNVGTLSYGLAAGTRVIVDFTG